MQIFIHRGKSKARDCGCGGKTADGPREELEALENEMRETEEKYTEGNITKEKWDEFRRRYVAERHRLTVAMREPSTGRIGYASAGARRAGRDADISGIVSELKRLELDNSGFDALIARIRNDPSIKQPEMWAIAAQYMGYELAKSKPKSYILQQIINRQMVIARQEARGAVLGSKNFKSW